MATGIKDEQDVAGQIRLVEQMVAEGVNALVIAPADSQALVAACKKAQDAGIVVVNIDNKLDAAVLASARSPSPSSAPTTGRAREGRPVCGPPPEAGSKVAILEGVPGAFNAVERRIGFERAAEAAGLRRGRVPACPLGDGQGQPDRLGPAERDPDLKALLCATTAWRSGRWRRSGRRDARDRSRSPASTTSPPSESW